MRYVNFLFQLAFSDSTPREGETTALWLPGGVRGWGYLLASVDSEMGGGMFPAACQRWEFRLPTSPSVSDTSGKGGVRKSALLLLSLWPPSHGQLWKAKPGTKAFWPHPSRRRRSPLLLPGRGQVTPPGLVWEGRGPQSPALFGSNGEVVA